MFCLLLVVFITIVRQEGVYMLPYELLMAGERTATAPLDLVGQTPRELLAVRSLPRQESPPIADDRFILTIMIIVIYKMVVGVIRWWRLRFRPASEVESLRKELKTKNAVTAALEQQAELERVRSGNALAAAERTIEILREALAAAKLEKAAVDEGNALEESEIFADHLKDRIDDFHCSEVIGTGSAGEVRYAEHQGTGRLFASKIIDKSMIGEDEIDIQSSLRHPNIVRLFGVAPRIAFYVRDMAQALIHVHSRGIIHRDVKLENMLVSNSGDLKLADFGVSVLTNAKCYLRAGTIYCNFSPEMIQGRGYDCRVDIWAAGVALYKLLVGTLPFYDRDKKKMKEKICRAELQWPEDGHISSGAKDLVTGLLRKDPVERLTLEEVLTHPWVVENTREDAELEAEVDTSESEDDM